MRGDLVMANECCKTTKEFLYKSKGLRVGELFEMAVPCRNVVNCEFFNSIKFRVK